MHFEPRKRYNAGREGCQEPIRAAKHPDFLKELLSFGRVVRRRLLKTTSSPTQHTSRNGQSKCRHSLFGVMVSIR